MDETLPLFKMIYKAIIVLFWLSIQFLSAEMEIESESEKWQFHPQ